MEGRIEERIGKGLESYAAVTQKTQKQEPIIMKEIIKEAMAQQAEEEKDIERRNANIIIYRVPEDTTGGAGGETSEMRDRTFLKELMEGPLELNHASDPIKHITRLGKKGEANTERPMLVKLATSAVKIEFMKNLKKLKSANDRFKRISVTHDLTVKQREAVKEALEATKREQNSQASAGGGSDSGNWKLRVVDQQKVPRVVRVKVG